MTAWSWVTPTLIGIAVNALILSWVLGKLFATVEANGKWLRTVSDRVRVQEDKVHHLHVSLTTVTATCAAYFATNPSPAAANTMRDVLAKLEELS